MSRVFPVTVAFSLFSVTMEDRTIFGEYGTYGTYETYETYRICDLHFFVTALNPLAPIRLIGPIRPISTAITKLGLPGASILARGELQRHYAITALRSGQLAGPAFLPVARCGGITALRNYEVGNWPDRHSCPWCAAAALRNYGITKWATGRDRHSCPWQVAAGYRNTGIPSLSPRGQHSCPW